MTSELPAAHGYAMPAEWEPHDRTWMGWPCRAELWGARIGRARAAYAAVAKAIRGFEPLTMVARPEHAAEARSLLGAGIDVVECPIDDSWTRDIGPSFVRDRAGKLAGIDWRFNAWGSKYPDYADDDAFAGRVLEAVDLPAFRAPFVLEGGSIHVDGEGTILTSEQCLLNPNRNPGMSRGEIERALCDWLGGSRVIWLGQGLLDDGTDGHVDNLACFVRPGLVVALAASDPTDANNAALSDNLARLRGARDARGRSLEVVTIEQPAERRLDGLRMALSYINFYLPTGGVVAPSFDDPADAAAHETLRRLFPDRSLAVVPALDILAGGGGIHCITQQQPKAGAQA